MVFVSILVKKSLMYWIYLFIYLFIYLKGTLYAEINESDMLEHGCSACGKRNLYDILSL